MGGGEFGFHTTWTFLPSSSLFLLADVELLKLLLGQLLNAGLVHEPGGGGNKSGT